MKQVLDFMRSSEFPVSRWLRNRKMEIYVRKTYIYVGDKHRTALVLANINVFKPGCGTFTKLLTTLEQKNICDVLVIENVLSERFRSFFKRRGYVAKGPGMLPSYYKVTHETG